MKKTKAILSIIFAVLGLTSIQAQNTLLLEATEVETAIFKLERESNQNPNRLKTWLSPQSDQAASWNALVSRLNQFGQSLFKASQTTDSVDSLRIQQLAGLAERHLGVQTRAYMLWLRGVHLLGGTQKTVAFPEALAVLKLQSPAALAVVSKFPYQARHDSKDSTSVNFRISQEERAFLEYVVLSRSPENWAKEAGLGIPEAAVPFQVDTQNSTPIFDFANKADYGKFLQFNVIRDSLVNRWAINRLFKNKVPEQPIPSCGREIVAFRPGKNGKMASSDFYQELLKSDQYESFVRQVPSLFKSIQDVSIGNSALYHEIYFASLNGVQAFSDWKDNQLPESYDEWKVLAAKKLWRFENEAFVPKGQSVIQNAQFVGDDFDVTMVAQRIADSVYSFRKDALVFSLIKMAQQDFPGVNVLLIRAHAERMIESYRKNFLATIKSRVIPILGQIVSSEEAEARRASRYQNKVNDLETILNLFAPVAMENAAIKTLQKYSDITTLKTPDYYKTVIQTPDLLNLYLDAKLRTKPGERLGLALSKQPELKALIKEFFDALNANYAETRTLHQAAAHAARALDKKYPTQRMKWDDPKKYERSSTTAIVNSKFRTDLPIDVKLTLDQAKEILFSLVHASSSTVDNRHFTPTLFDLLIVTEIKMQQAYYLSPLLRSSWVIIPPRDAKAYKPLKDYTAGESWRLAKLGHVTKNDGSYETPALDLAVEKTLLEHVGDLYSLNSKNPPKMSDIQSKTRDLIHTALNRVHKAAANEVETFCQANPQDPKNDKKFKLLFRAATATRHTLKSPFSSFGNAHEKLAKLDSELAKETRYWHEAVYEDYVSPIASAVMTTAMILALIAMVIKAPILITVSAVFSKGLVWPVIGAQLYFQSTAYLIELPPQIRFQESVLQSQLGENPAVADWESVKADTKKHTQNVMVTLANVAFNVTQISGLKDAFQFWKNPLRSIQTTYQVAVARQLPIDPLLTKEQEKLKYMLNGGGSKSLAPTVKTFGDIERLTLPSGVVVDHRVKNVLLERLDDIAAVGMEVSESLGIQKMRLEAVQKMLGLLDDTIRPDQVLALIQTHQLPVITRLLPKSGVQALQQGTFESWFGRFGGAWMETLRSKEVYLKYAVQNLGTLETRLASGLAGGNVTGKKLIEMLDPEDLYGLLMASKMQQTLGHRGPLATTWASHLRESIQRPKEIVSPIQFIPNEAVVSQSALRDDLIKQYALEGVDLQTVQSKLGLSQIEATQYQTLVEKFWPSVAGSGDLSRSIRKTLFDDIDNLADLTK